MDFVRVQGLTLRPPSETVRGCSRRHRQQMQLKLGSVYQSGGNSGVFQKLKPGLALRPGGRRCRGKGTGGVRASIPPDAAVAAFTTAVAGCWLYMNKLKLSSTSPENSESAATASASLKPRTSVSGPDISSIHSQRTEATSAEVHLSGLVASLFSAHSSFPSRVSGMWTASCLSCRCSDCESKSVFLWELLYVCLCLRSCERCHAL